MTLDELRAASKREGGGMTRIVLILKHPDKTVRLEFDEQVARDIVDALIAVTSYPQGGYLEFCVDDEPALFSTHGIVHARRDAMSDLLPSSLADCPRCGKKYTPYGVKWEPGMPPYAATSRRDHDTYVCYDCGVLEALEDASGRKYSGNPYWKVKP